MQLLMQGLPGQGKGMEAGDRTWTHGGGGGVGVGRGAAEAVPMGWENQNLKEP